MVNHYTKLLSRVICNGRTRVRNCVSTVFSLSRGRWATSAAYCFRFAVLAMVITCLSPVPLPKDDSDLPKAF